MKIIDLTGKTFGKLYVKNIHSRKNGRIYYKCKCECGKEAVISKDSLNAGKKHCGCLPRSDTKDITNKMFGKLKVINYIESKKRHGHSRTIWKCQCECGNTVEVFGFKLLQQITKSCGCLKYEKNRGENSSNWKGGKIKTKHGYILVLDRGHPNARKNGYVLEHVSVMSKHIKRPLSKKETVHHKNGIRDDNRFENLELWSTRHGKGQRINDLIEDAIYILKKYSPNLLK